MFCICVSLSINISFACISIYVVCLKCKRLYFQDELPSPYAIYKFYDFADHDTGIIQHSGSPEFNDSHVYPILMNSELDRYIKSQVC